MEVSGAPWSCLKLVESSRAPQRPPKLLGASQRSVECLEAHQSPLELPSALSRSSELSRAPQSL
eukprot:7744807-Alexandrium_andersonii.AAC.1